MSHSEKEPAPSSAKVEEALQPRDIQAENIVSLTQGFQVELYLSDRAIIDWKSGRTESMSSRTSTANTSSKDMVLWTSIPFQT